MFKTYGKRTVVNDVSIEVRGDIGVGRGALAVQDGVQALPGGALGAGVPGRKPGGAVRAE